MPKSTKDPALEIQDTINKSLLENIKCQIVLQTSRRDCIHEIETKAVHVKHKHNTKTLLNSHIISNRESLHKIRLLDFGDETHVGSTNHVDNIKKLRIFITDMQQQLLTGWSLTQRARQRHSQSVEMVCRAEADCMIACAHVNANNSHVAHFPCENDAILFDELKDEDEFAKKILKQSHDVLHYAEECLLCEEEQITLVESITKNASAL